MKSLVLILCLMYVAIVSGQSDYCSLCANHIACGHPGTFDPTCPADATIVSLGASEINLLLDTHNGHRNNIAGGLVPPFLSARAMNVLSWDHELAFLAELNVKQCAMRHDSCRATAQFPYAGQNLYMHGTSGAFNPIANQLLDAVNRWFNEYTLASPNDINSCCGGENFYNIGHFLQVVQDRAIRIGCAASRFTDGQWRRTLVACNYSWPNFLNSPVYVTGAAGSGCSSRNSVFTNLCNA